MVDLCLKIMGIIYSAFAIIVFFINSKDDHSSVILIGKAGEGII